MSWKCDRQGSMATLRRRARALAGVTGCSISQVTAHAAQPATTQWTAAAPRDARGQGLDAPLAGDKGNGGGTVVF